MLQKKQTKADMSTYLLVDCFQFFFFLHDMQNNFVLDRGKSNKVYYGTESVFFLGASIIGTYPKFLKRRKNMFTKIRD